MTNEEAVAAAVLGALARLDPEAHRDLMHAATVARPADRVAPLRAIVADVVREEWKAQVEGGGRKLTAPAPAPVEPFTRGHLLAALQGAAEQCFGGKGEERHGGGKPLEVQPWVDISGGHGVGFLTGQAEKKAREVPRLPTVDARIRELRGVIVYAAFAIMRYEVEKAAGAV